jgi:sulfotransferase family protein
MTPVLVHIGYHRTGTKWLRGVVFANPAAGFRWLGKDPEDHPVRRLLMERPLDFDPGAIRRALDPLLSEAENAGLVPVIAIPSLSGHPFAGGRDSKEIADRLRQVVPDARILIVVREQCSMIRSTYKQYVRAGGPCKLMRFLEPPPKWRRPAFDYGHFEYDRLIGYYHSLFGRDAVLALPYEQFVEDGPAFVRGIAEFAGRPISPKVLERLPFQRMNKGRSALAIAVTRPLNHLCPATDVNLSPVLESNLVLRLARRVQRVDPRKIAVTRSLAARSERRLRNQIAEAVGDRYAVSNRATAELIGVDLGMYGWTV